VQSSVVLNVDFFVDRSACARAHDAFAAK
jgi:hypothetical protein